jgi:hypothetical protein
MRSLLLGMVVVVVVVVVVVESLCALQISAALHTATWN